MRTDSRQPDQLRPIVITPNYLRHAEGSVLITAGGTHVICAASVEDRVPPFRRNSGKGWITAEYGMLPRATQHAHDARSLDRQGRRAHTGDPAPDRPLAALGGQARSARRAHDLGGLRRHPGGRRHAHGGDHGRLRGARAGAAAPARAGPDQEHPGAGLRGGDERRHHRAACRCSTWRTRKTRARTST